MSHKIKNLIKKNKIIYRIATYLFTIFQYIKNTPLRDYFNLERWILFSKISPFTKVPYLRLTNTYNLARKVEENRIDGAFVECGVWKGGCAAVMAYAARKSDRKIWLFDSFEGLPEPTKEDDNANKISDSLVASIEDCKEILFNRLKLNESNIVIRKGWFRDILPKSKPEIGKIAILRIDADWYESTKQCLENLYDNVVSGGYVIIDDYGYFSGCKKAVDEFIEGKNIKIDTIDGIGIFFPQTLKMKDKLIRLLKKLHLFNVVRPFHRLFWRIVYGWQPYKKAKIGDFIIFVDLRDPRGRSIYITKDYSPGTGKVLPRLWKSSFVLSPNYFLDIGANYGEVSLTTKYPRNTKKIYLIEANPKVSKALAKSVDYHPNKEKIELIEKAVSDIDGKRVLLHVPESSAGLGFTVNLNKLYKDIKQEKFEVMTITLDALLADITSQTVAMKIDVEGGELDVLKGAQNFLARNKTLVFVEVSTVYLEALGISPISAFELLNSLGRVYFPDEKKKEFIPLKNLDYPKIWSTFLERGFLSDYYKPKDSIVGDFILFSNNFNENEIEKYFKSVY